MLAGGDLELPFSLLVVMESKSMSAPSLSLSESNCVVTTGILRFSEGARGGGDLTDGEDDGLALSLDLVGLTVSNL
jgi:hypothetical protein